MKLCVGDETAHMVITLPRLVALLDIIIVALALSPMFMCQFWGKKDESCFRVQ